MKSIRLLTLLVFFALASSASGALSTFVAPEAVETRCTTDSECMVVSTSCDGCCQQAAINKSGRTNFEAKVTTCQREWRKQKILIACDCAPPVVKARCTENKCRLENGN